MSTEKKVSKALSAVLPGGALGASIVLALATSTPVLGKPGLTANPSPMGISDRLQAIRAGVSEISDPARSAGATESMAGNSGEFAPAWWGNGGWGRWRSGWRNGGVGWPNWHNWGNAHPGWGNASPVWGNASPGWGNASPGWANAPPSGGPAGPGWGNAGPGWGNGWHNYWHNG